MGLYGVSTGSLLVILFLAMLLFGTSKLRNIGEDLGAAVRSFKKGLQEEDDA